MKNPAESEVKHPDKRTLLKFLAVGGSSLALGSAIIYESEPAANNNQNNTITVFEPLSIIKDVSLPLFGISSASMIVGCWKLLISRVEKE